MTGSPTNSFRSRLMKRFRRARLRTQLLVIINASLAALLVGLIVVDYRYSLQSRVRDKQVALSEEARTVASAVNVLQARGADVIQQYIDSTCALMNDQDSPGHSIEVRAGAEQFVADPEAHRHHVVLSGQSAISGTYNIDDVAVRISEQRGPVVDAALRAEIGRVAAIVMIGMISAVILNVLVVRLVTRPLERLARDVRAIRWGRFGRTTTLSANAEVASLSGEVAAMSAELDRREKDRKLQLERARRLQSHLIGAPRREGALEVAIEYHPADEVAGDFVDVMACPNGDMLLCVADVVGHGIHAAMGSGMLKALLLSGECEDASPSAILESVNTRFYNASLPEDFASMILVRITHDGRHAVYASAGHEPGYVRSADGSCRPLPSTGMLLGVLDESTYDDLEIDFNAGDTVVLISDGISETLSPDEAVLGRASIVEAIRSATPDDPQSVALAVLDASRRHRGAMPARDDETVLAFGLAALGAQDAGARAKFEQPARSEHARAQEEAL